MSEFESEIEVDSYSPEEAARPPESVHLDPLEIDLEYNDNPNLQIDHPKSAPVLRYTTSYPNFLSLSSKYTGLDKFSFNGLASARSAAFAELSPIRSKLSSWASRYTWLWPWSLRAAVFFALHTILLEYLIIMLWFVGRPDDLVVVSSLPVQAISMIAIGEYARTNLAAGLVESLEKHNPSLGNTVKHFLLTDAPECFMDNELFANISIIPVEYEQEGLSDLEKDLKAKSFKTRLFEFLPSEVTKVLYLDIDIRVTDRFVPWLDSLQEEIEDQQHDIILPGERIYADSPFNSGVMILDREDSRECLSAWGEAILSGKYKMDQHALIKIREDGEQCTKMLVLDHADTMLYMRDFFSMLFFELGIARKAPMLHYTKSLKVSNEMDEGCSSLWSCGRLWMVERVYLREKLDKAQNCGAK